MSADIPLPPADVGRLTESLVAFSALRESGDDAYLDMRETPQARDERVRSYLRIRRGLADAKRVLDWGCRHGATAQLVRTDFGAAVELLGTDICDPAQYRRFHESCALDYRRVEHPWRLAYADDSFDAVIAAGVLEHVASTHDSLTELWRVLRFNGVLLITHLPNAFSWSEWVSRRFFPAQAHARTYRSRDIRRQLLDHGFLIEDWGYHGFPPTALPPTLERSRILQGTLRALQPLHILERAWPLRGLSAAMWLIVRKRQGF